MFIDKTAFFLLLTVCMAPIAAAGAQNEPVSAERLGQYLRQERQIIEDGYNMRLEVLRQQARLRAQRLSRFEKALWVEYFRMQGQKVGPDQYYQNITADTALVPRVVFEPGRLRRELIGRYFADQAARMMLDSRAYEQVRAITADAAVRKDSLLWRRAFAVEQIMKPLQVELSAIETRRQNQLRKLRQQAQQLRREAEQGRPGRVLEPAGQDFVVSAIAIGPRPLAMIGGEIVRPGQSVGDVRVVRILDESVEFERPGQSWSQKLGELPPG